MFVGGSWLALVPVMMMMLRLVVNMKEKKEGRMFSYVCYNEGVNVTSHTSQRAASLEKGKGQPRRAGPPGTKAWEREMKFLCFI